LSTARNGIQTSGNALHERNPATNVSLSMTVLESFRKMIIHRGGHGGISALGLTFSIMDTNHDSQISLPELKIALERFGLKMSDLDLEMLMTSIDHNHGRCFSYNDFLVAVRGPVSKRRLDIINMAFQVLDKNGNGRVELDDLSNYETNHDPDVQAGKVSHQDALNLLISNFGGRNGVITKQQFTNHYKNVSSSIGDDDYFELMMRNAWHMPGGSGWCENTANTRILVTFATGEQKVVCLDDDLGLDIRNRAAVMKCLKKQGVNNVVDFSHAS
jgi:Ca2+-binding EF-hand superfamily protein